MGVFWTLCGTASRRLLSATSTIIVARLFGPELFGNFAMIQSTVGLFAAYASLRLGTAATKYIAEFRISNPPRAARVLKLTTVTSFFLCLLVGALLSLASDVIASETLAKPDLQRGLMLGGILVFLIYTEVQQNALAGFEDFRLVARLNLLWGLATLACAPLMGWYWGIEGALVGLSIAGFVTLFATSRALVAIRMRHSFPMRVPMRDALRELPVLWHYAVPGVLISAFAVLAVWASKAILVRQDGGFVQLGFYGAADQWRAIVLILPAIIVRVMLPMLSDSRLASDTAALATTLQMQFRSVLVAALPLSCAMMGFTDIITLSYGPSYTLAEPVLAVSMFSVFLSAVNQPLTTVFTAVGSRWRNLRMHIAWSALFFGLSLVLVARMHALGLALSMVLADFALLLWQFAYIDTRLAPRSLRPLSPLFLFGASLLITCYAAGRFLDHALHLATTLVLTVAALVPALRLLRARLRQSLGIHPAGKGPFSN